VFHYDNYPPPTNKTPLIENLELYCESFSNPYVLAEKNKTFDREYCELVGWASHFGVEVCKTPVWKDINANNNLTEVIDTVDNHIAD